MSHLSGGNLPGGKLVKPDDRMSNHGPLIAGLMLIFLGVYFLLERLEFLPPFQKSWPAVLVIVGIALVVTYIVSYSQKR